MTPASQNASPDDQCGANLLLPAFESGQFVSQLAWHLMQYAIVREREHRLQWAQVLANLAGKVITVVPSLDSAIALNDSIGKLHDNWQAKYDSLDFGEDLSSARIQLQSSWQRDNC